MNFGQGLPFNSIGYIGGGKQNGIPSTIQGVGPLTIGGILSTANTATSGAGFGAVVSRLPGAPNEFYYGAVTSGFIAGILQFDAGIAQNDPAHPNYPLLGQPITVGIDGSYHYNGWNASASGAVQPVPGCVVIFNNTTGEIQFVANGQGAPGGWTVLTGAYVSNTDELGFNGITIQIRMQS